MKSKLAVISFILGLISLSTLLVWIVPIGGILQSKIINISLFNIFIAPVGLILGIISIFIIKRNKLGGIWFSILGILFSLIGILMIFRLILGFAGVIGNFL